MADEIVYAKTQKGFEEMTRRTYRLPARMRSMLIMIDGRLTAGELFARAPHHEEAQQFIELLLRDGFIEPTGSSETSTEANEDEPTVDAAKRSLVAAKRYVSQAMVDALGAEADHFTVQVDAAGDATALRAIALKYLEVVRSLSNDRKAEAFRDGLVQLQLISPSEGQSKASPKWTTRPAELDIAKKVMVQALINTLGPDADRFTMAAEQASSADELRALLSKYQEVVRSIGGKKRAEDFVTAVNAALGS